jgi:hypothetical protein
MIAVLCNAALGFAPTSASRHHTHTRAATTPIYMQAGPGIAAAATAAAAVVEEVM